MLPPTRRTSRLAQPSSRKSEIGLDSIKIQDPQSVGFLGPAYRSINFRFVLSLAGIPDHNVILYYPLIHQSFFDVLLVSQTLSKSYSLPYEGVVTSLDFPVPPPPCHLAVSLTVLFVRTCSASLSKMSYKTSH